MKEMRRKLDFYQTPHWQTDALVRRVPIHGTALECCAGDGSLALCLRNVGIHTNDIDAERQADFHLDAAKAESWAEFPVVDWVITNPPFNKAIEILQHAHGHARIGVIMLLRLSFLEPTEKRASWLCANPPTRQIILPRWSYKGNGSTDSVTTAWMIWSRFVPPGIDIVPPSEKPGAKE